MEPTNQPVPQNNPSSDPYNSSVDSASAVNNIPSVSQPKLSGSNFGGRTIEPLESTAPQLDSSHLEIPFEPAAIAQPNQQPQPSIPPKPSIPPQPIVPPQPAVSDNVYQSTQTATNVTNNPTQTMPPQNPAQNIITNPVAYPAPTAFVSQDVPESQLPPVPKKSRFKISKPIVAGLSVFVLLAGGLGFYFGYYNNPSVIYSQSMKNTTKGYEKLVEYVDQETSKSYKGSQGSGSMSIKSAGGTSDGNVTFKADDKASQFNFDLGLGVTRLTADARFFYVGEDSADIYLKAGGIKGLGSLAGIPQLDAQLDKLDESWIVIDHTLIDNLNQLASDSGESANNMNMPTQEQLMDEALAFGRVNSEYIFTTDEEKSIMEVTKKYGFETIQDKKTYHYQATLNKANIKKYIDAQEAALKSSKLQKWIKDSGSEELASGFFDSLKESADTIKSTDTIDVWVDADQRIIYKVRFADKKKPLDSYLDVGLNYKGDDNFPFFLSGYSKTAGSESKFNLIMNLDTADSSIDVKMDVQTGKGQDATTMNAKFEIKPSNQSVKIEKPANAKQLAQVLSELGYGDILSQLQAINTPNNTLVN